MIEIKNVNKTYKSKAKEEVKAMADVNLQFSRSGLVFILGKSGSGKSTFLNILGGLDSANSSRIFINNKKLDRFDETTCSQYRNTYIGFVFQEYNLLDDLNVYKNVELALSMQGKTDTRDTILRVLASVGLEGLEERELDELSGGQKQRVAIARALVKDPTIILADEPTGNLDSETSEQIFDLFKQLSHDKLIIVVSHDAEYAYKYADRIIEISDGNIIRDTDPIAKPDAIQAPDMIKPVLPWDFIFRMSIGNILNNKLRMVVTSVIVSFLIAILTAVYTMLYVNPAVTSDLMALSGQQQLLLTKTTTQDVLFSFRPVETVVTELEPEVVDKIRVIADDYGATLYPKTRLVVPNPLTGNDQALTIADFKLNPMTPVNIESDLIIDPDQALIDAINATALSFTAVSANDPLLDHLTGSAPLKNDEIVISNYLADLLIATGSASGAKSHQELLDTGLTLNPTGHYPMKIVGIVTYETPLLKNEKTVLDTVAANLYVHQSLLDKIPLKAVTDSYGLIVSGITDINALTKAIKGAGSVTVLPNYTEQLNRYTRYDLTLVISILVPVLGYLALVFLGNYISSSILFRKRQIGILRAIGNYISNVEHVFRLEAIAVGIIVMVLVSFMVPTFVNIVNFAFMVHFQDTFISLYHYRIYAVGFGSIVEIFFMLVLLITMLTFTLTHNINLIDPVDVISGR